ncbi:raffinose/stachyose/melibiose transport system substrate-binding protein [Nonomuraea solani]|uniref:Raffinose/stachyose/melibiose transport system substrate-binding protein n=1 Tax=Nonomuraea solani TaxID=1144553 RepID=A0A1H6EVZ5_9ACTN|nr:extracellular solute-binding protein [Nonomuraea solani]SEH02008.1 raffinose/stachyose/melibiose transport system substrate-binding protein [Nonomuraea solani]
MALLRRRTSAILAAAAVALAGLTGCGSGGGSGGKTKLAFFSWDNEQTMKPLIDAFEKQNPAIEIEFSNAPPVAEYISTLQTRLVSGTGADVFLIAAENKTNLIEGKFVLDLTGKPYMANVSKFNSATYAKDGKAYGMSLSSWSGGILYNNDLLAKAGVTEFPTKWDDFLALCQKLKAAGVTPFYDTATAMPLTLAALVGHENAAKGGDVDAKIFAGTATFGELWNGPLTNWNKLITSGVMSKDVVGLKGDQIVDEFAGGRVAMIAGGPWDVPTLHQKAPDLKMTFAGVPTPDGKPFWAGAASPGFAINAKTERLKEAEAFLTYLSSKDAVSLYNKQTKAMTTTSDYEPQIDEVLRPNFKALQEGRFYLPQIAWERNQDALNTEAVAQIQLMVQGQAQPAAVATALDNRLKSAG